MYLSRRIVYQRQQGIKRNLRVAQHLFRHPVHEVGIIIGKDTRYVQTLAVVLVRLVDSPRQHLR